MSARVEELRRARPRDGFLRVSCALIAVAMLGAWVFGGFDFGDTFSERRADNFARFLHDIRPFPLQGREWDFGIAWEWATDLLARRGFDAIVGTLAIAVLSVVFAAVSGALLAVLAARTLATAEPLSVAAMRGGGWRAAGWNALSAGVRLSLIVMRSMPEYVLAFLFLAMLGPNAWPLVLALAIHNAGILGRLYAETIENADPSAPRALRGIGAGRRQIAAVALWPAALSRGLLYAFYRWETCVREATVLGMLGVVSLGYWIADARNREHYDDLVLLIGLGVVLVLAGDLVSAWVRRAVR